MRVINLHALHQKMFAQVMVTKKATSQNRTNLVIRVSKAKKEKKHMKRRKEKNPARKVNGRKERKR